ncbi:addiction module toxin RelE [Rhizobium rhizosphaerae]|uniref:Addiction module toxin RelE n=1 Tax=Xaviernesmea rhizosphaerae TaxID=1672749 RepID=A0ABX3PGR0_9HYPH|nr:type II toxin-antitoxin system YafQ family toxin [Xaviernesmea rhizosphaerae]OQP87307.1 addiction module toxin RelE [Xaviernesmea rhizosphaerae]
MKKTSADRRAPLPRRSDYTRAFRKDWARYSKAGKADLNRAIELMALIILKRPLGAEWSDHELSGKEWEGAREAHIGGDFLLIYLCDDDSVDFVSLGSHSELFGR